jgi:outer membrane protein assembly factor BamD (BamD/ComL family)
MWSALDETLPGRIFISYRRQETAWPARQLYDVLVEHFPAEEVFKDIDNIDPGDEFVERITAAVESCDVLLALIGPNWLTITNKKGQRRLDDPEDYVRLEIETALTRKIRVIPILVDEARMPGADELPATLAPLVRRNAVEINPVTFDTKRLISTVQKTLAALKVSDTTTRSASPTPTASPDSSNQQVAGAEVEQLYDQGLAAFWTEQWDRAVELLGQVLSRQPDYAEAARKLELARRQQQLASHYAQASAAADAADWEQAVAGYTMVADSDPDYQDTNARLAEARHQQQLARLLAEAHRLHRARQWAAVIKVGEQLRAIDPSAADPDELITSAHAELAAEQQAAQLAADYHTSLHLFDTGRWEEAIEALERITRLDSAHQDAPALLERARRELEQAAAAKARQRAEEQARRQTEHHAGREAEERVLRHAEELAGRQEKHPPRPNPPASNASATDSTIVRGEMGRLLGPTAQRRDKFNRPAVPAIGIFAALLIIIVAGIAGIYGRGGAGSPEAGSIVTPTIIEPQTPSASATPSNRTVWSGMTQAQKKLFIQTPFAKDCEPLSVADSVLRPGLVAAIQCRPYAEGYVDYMQYKTEGAMESAFKKYVGNPGRGDCEDNRAGVRAYEERYVAKGKYACFKRGNVRLIVWYDNYVSSVESYNTDNLIIYRFGSKTDSYEALFNWWSNHGYQVEPGG